MTKKLSLISGIRELKISWINDLLGDCAELTQEGVWYHKSMLRTVRDLKNMMEESHERQAKTWKWKTNFYPRKVIDQVIAYTSLDEGLVDCEPVDD